MLLVVYLLTKLMNGWYVWQAGGQNQELVTYLTGIAILLPVLVLFAIAKLETHYDHDGIHIRYFPFHFQWHFYSRDEITEISAGTYSPLRDFTGWGIRYGKGGYKAFTVFGKSCIRVVMRDGRKRLLGTQYPEKAAEYVKTF